MKFHLHGAGGLNFRYARSITKYYAKSFYLCTLLLSKHKRWATYAVYGLCRYVDNIVDSPRARSREEVLAEIRHVESELRIAYREGESQHPVIQPFSVAAQKYKIPMEYALDLLKGVLMDTEKNRYQTFDELYVFCYRVASVVGLMMTPVLGYSNPTALVYAEKLGIAMQLTNILRDVLEDKNAGRIYFPQDEMKRFGVTDEDILAERATPQFLEMMKFNIDRARKYYQEAEPGIAMLDKESQFAIYAASAIYSGILGKLEARGCDPFPGRVFVPKGKKIRILLGELLRTRIFGKG